MSTSLIKRLRGLLGSLKRTLLEVCDKARRQLSTPEMVFTDIYRKRKWGVASSEQDFDSGLGSATSQAVEAYVDAVKSAADTWGFKGKTFVDIGCGDFRVGKQLVSLAGQFIGLDVVKPLVERNNRLFARDNVRFEHADATRDRLPEGDVCLLRQVLQHLSNGQIAAILPQLAQYEWVIITEHLPSDGDLIQPNLDKLHGADIRVLRNSGVYLDQPPFSLPQSKLSLILEVPGTDLGSGVNPGIIRTHLYKPSKQT